jgi:DUF1365 family protein
MNSRLYIGKVSHRRFTPVSNQFSYQLFMLYLDLDELPGLFDPFWLWSARRRAPAWYRRADFMGDPQRPLADCVRDRIQSELGWAPAGPIRLLTHLRYVGHNFNPVSFYYCFDPDGGPLRVIVAEITNTPWQERHAYVLPVDQAGTAPAPWRFEFDKAFHVSPFMPMEQHYRWRFGEPGDRLAVYMESLQDGQRVFDAGLDLEAQPIRSGTLARALARFPAMTLRVVAQIHWQALKLLLKRVPFHSHPAPGR